MPDVDQSNQQTTPDSPVEPRPGTDVGTHSASSEVIRIEKFFQSFLHRTFKRTVNFIFGVVCRRRFGSFGRNSRVNVPAWIKGHRSIHVGDNVHIWRSSRITAITTRPDQRLIIIDDDCIIHPSVHISAVKSIHVGKSVLVAANCYITDHDHMWQDVENPPIRNEQVIASPTRICDEVWLGEKVTVLKGVTIGRNSIIGSGSVVTKNVPPFSVAVGNPARVIRSYDHESGTWKNV